jgi:hypothetical protein
MFVDRAYEKRSIKVLAIIMDFMVCKRNPKEVHVNQRESEVGTMVSIENCATCGGAIGGKFKKFCSTKCRVTYAAKKKLVGKLGSSWTSVTKKLSKTLEEAGEKNNKVIIMKFGKNKNLG